MQILKHQSDGQRVPMSESAYNNAVFMDELEHMIRTPDVVIVRDKAGTIPARQAQAEENYRYGGRSLWS